VGQVPFGEDQGDHSQHGRKAARQLARARHAERDPRLADLALGAHQALRHGRLGNTERGRDLRRGQPAHRAQREPDPGGRVERGMAEFHAASSCRDSSVPGPGSGLSAYSRNMYFTMHHLSWPAGMPA